jgi:uncharacterized protein YegL
MRFCPCRLSVVPFALLCGCVGLRTPLDEAAIPDADFCKTPSATHTTHTTHATADVLIVLDRSESMTFALGSDTTCSGTNCTSRLSAISSAVGAVVTDNPDIHWGLELFSTPNSSTTCVVSSTPQVAVGANKASTIKSQLASLTTSASTPTVAALHVATDYLKKLSDGNNKAILLATDGAPSCNTSISDAVNAARAAKEAGFPVYVVGIGPKLDNLNSLAEDGGTGSYYPATSTSQLDGALRTIAKAVTSCSFKTDKVPADKDLVYVYVDDKLVNQDADNGWSFESADSTYSTITLTGTYCQNALSGATSKVDIVLYQCPGVTPPNHL